MTTTVAPPPVFQWLTANGPLVGGQLYSYAAGTSTPLATYADETGTAANPNPVILDANGSANVWLGSASYKLVLMDALNNVLWTVDNINATQTAFLPLTGGTVTGAVTFQNAVTFNNNVVIAQNLTVSGTLNCPNIVIPATLTIGTNSAPFATNIINAASGVAKQTQFQTAGLYVWAQGTDNSPQSGSNSGCNWELLAYDDTGALLGPVFTANRANQTVTTYAVWTGPNFVGTSDRDLKKNIKSLKDDYCLKIIKGMRPVSFQWKKSGAHDLGFIAQEVLDVVGCLVHESTQGYLGVDYDHLTAPIIGALQNILERLEALERASK